MTNVHWGIRVSPPLFSPSLYQVSLLRQPSPLYSFLHELKSAEGYQSHGYYSTHERQDSSPLWLKTNHISKLFKFSSSKFYLTAAFFIVLMKDWSNVVKANISIPCLLQITHKQVYCAGCKKQCEDIAIDIITWNLLSYHPF